MAKLDQISIGGTDYDFVPEVAPIFDATTAYEIGDWVIKDAVLYRFTTAHAAGAWDANQVEEITVGEEVEKALNKTVDVDKTLTIDGAAADSKTVGDELTTLKADLSDIDSVVSHEVVMSVSSVSNNYKLVEETGLCVNNNSYKLCKYVVTAGKRYKIISDDTFQFQTKANVPSSGSSNRVGQTYGVGEFIVTAPKTATYLIVSTPINNSTSTVYKYENIDLEDINDICYDRDNNVYHKNGKKATEYIQFVNGAIVGGHFDSRPVIAYHGKGLYSGDPVDRAGLCVTQTYPIVAGSVVTYYLSNPSSVSAGGINRYQDIQGAEIKYSGTVTVEAETDTKVLEGDKVRFSLFEDGVKDSYAYVKNTGDVLFAGENTQYYGKKNIDGNTEPSETLLSDKNVKEILLDNSGLIIGKDGKVHLSYKEGTTSGKGITFASGVIIDGLYDTRINIAEYNKVANSSGSTTIIKGGCYTEFYDLISENAQIKYYFPNPDNVSFANNQKIQWWRDDSFITYSHETMGSETNIRCNDQTNKANKFRCSLAIAGIDDSWCIDVATGTIIFAGKNTEYYGRKTITDIPKPPQRNYGVIGSNYPDEMDFIENHLVSGATYESPTGITNRFAFCHVSDVHGASANAWGIGYSNEFTDLSDASFLAMTGDNVSDKATDSFDNVKSLINGMSKPCFITFGNHDVAASTSQNTRFEHQFGEIKEHNDQSSLVTSYYAIDFAIGKQAEKQNTSGSNDSANGIKCIFLDCYDGIDDYTGYNMAQICDGHMSAVQINWFAEQLQEAITNSYHVAVFMHHAPDDIGRPVEKFFDYCEYAKNLTFIADMINAYQTYNSSVTFEHMGNNFTFNFSGSGSFVGYFVGHTHCDGIYYLKKYPKQLCVTAPTPFGNGSTYNGTNMNNGLGVIFNYVTIDKKKRRVTVFRIGNQDTYYGYKRDLFSSRYY